MKLLHKTAVVTGASQGLGKAIAKRFALEGAAVCLCARNIELLRGTNLEIMASGGKSIFEQTDVTDEEQVREFLSSCASSFGEIHILVNGASVSGKPVPLSEYSLPEWERVVAVNLTGTFLVTKHAVPLFGKRGGSIINLSSPVGRAGASSAGAHEVSKFGVEGLTQELAEELRPLNIRVNVVHPGALTTWMRPQAYTKERQPSPKKTEDFTDIFLYLASDESTHVTGKTFDAQNWQQK